MQRERNNSSSSTPGGRSRGIACEMRCLALVLTRSKVVPTAPAASESKICRRPGSYSRQVGCQAYRTPRAFCEIKDGEVVYSNDEATGGVHLSLVLAGHLGISYEAAEALKTSRQKTQELLPVVRPVIDKISSIVGNYLERFSEVKKVCMVGGTCELEGLSDIVARNLGLRTFRPQVPQVITPYGIALSCLNSNGQSPKE